MFTLVNDFGWQVDNYGATYSDTGLGINSPGHANANTKGADTSMLVGLAEDCYGISILFSGQNASTIIRRCFVDLLIDPDAGIGNTGSSWSVVIANLLANSPAFGNGNLGYWYYFPLFLKKGTAIGTAHQNLVAGTLPLRVSIRCFGKPSHPELLRVGTKVATIGATLATTTGTTVTPGTGAMGSWSASLGTLPYDAWWWQVGIASSDTTMNVNSYMFDVSHDATSKYICMQGVSYGVSGTIEQANKSALGSFPPIRNAKSGSDIYVRGAAVGTPSVGMTAIVYAMGG